MRESKVSDEPSKISPQTTAKHGRQDSGAKDRQKTQQQQQHPSRLKLLQWMQQKQQQQREKERLGVVGESTACSTPAQQGKLVPILRHKSLPTSLDSRAEGKLHQGDQLQGQLPPSSASSETVAVGPVGQPKQQHQDLDAQPTAQEPHNVSNSSPTLYAAVSAPVRVSPSSSGTQGSARNKQMNRAEGKHHSPQHNCRQTSQLSKDPSPVSGRRAEQNHGKHSPKGAHNITPSRQTQQQMIYQQIRKSPRPLQQSQNNSSCEISGKLGEKDEVPSSLPSPISSQKTAVHLSHQNQQQQYHSSSTSPSSSSSSGHWSRPTSPLTIASHPPALSKQQHGRPPPPPPPHQASSVHLPLQQTPTDKSGDHPSEHQDVWLPRQSDYLVTQADIHNLYQQITPRHQRQRNAGNQQQQQNLPCLPSINSHQGSLYQSGSSERSQSGVPSSLPQHPHPSSLMVVTPHPALYDSWDSEEGEESLV